MSSKTKSSSSVQSEGERPPFGCRLLTSDADVWSQSAWDHVPPPNDQDDIISAALERQRTKPVPPNKKARYNSSPRWFWDQFYKNNKDNFFRDRKWLHLEFPDLMRAVEPDAGPVTVVEIGCGAGNSVFPLLTANRNPYLRIFACDYAPEAIKIVKDNPLYASPAIGTIAASVWDLASLDSLPEGIEEGQVDMAILIFVLSALSPKEWHRALHNLHRILKPGGKVLLRDYGRHDLTQLRFREERLLEENFYIRGDGTRVYFFELDELAVLFTGLPAPKHLTQVTESSEPSMGVEGQSDIYPPLPDVPSPDASRGSLQSAIFGQASGSGEVVVDQLQDEATNIDRSADILISSCQDCDNSLPSQPLFSIKQLGVDRRLLVNRKRQLKMYRVWMQAQFVKD
ncbi:S-adenosyl-L-methionine-dependent methyltransferase [Cantharellus anzutake]|uniref:S-adenosyl-L-methionine-dependent methyltransferase n=1 Tax=Cantharellus anzutake TaxID=1750568 RepID=UPI0019071354|nr:S-adenosyl-L-methionine-dependent methyltransferase [Cantharellus anzutake]KAF8329376.1 S-adenosyl-L-methionine-dependent methyltransferase [Cantharellus anzutake]